MASKCGAWNTFPGTDVGESGVNRGALHWEKEKYSIFRILFIFAILNSTLALIFVFYRLKYTLPRQRDVKVVLYLSGTSWVSAAFCSPSRQNTLGSTNLVPSPLQAMVIETGGSGGEIHHKRTPEPLKKCTPSPLHCHRHKSLHGTCPHIRSATFLCAHENSFLPREANGHLF
jgi:hypothetical protein